MKRFLSLTLVLLFSLGLSAQQTYKKVRIDLKQTSLSQIAAAGIDVTEGFLKKGAFFETDLSADEISRLNQEGIRAEVIIEDVSKYYADRLAAEKPANVERNRDEEWVVPENWEYGSMGGYYTLDEIYRELDSMAIKYPDLITSRQTLSDDTLTVENRKMWWVKISDNPQTDEDEPEILYTALHHAREAITGQQMIFYMWYLLENYETDSLIRYIVDNTEMYFIPVLNPDGYEYNYTTNPNGGGMWRKNRKDNGDGTYGVDLNRNYGYYWGYNDIGSSPYTWDETYRGVSAFSESETKNIRDFCNAREFLFTLNYHSYGNMLLSPWGYTSTPPPDNDNFLAFGDYLTMENNYTYGPANVTIYEVNGDSDDWMYGEQDTKNAIYAYTPEAGNGNDGFWPSVSRIIPLCKEQMWQNISLAMLAGNFARVSNMSPLITDQTDNYAVFKIQRLGLSDSGSFTVSITPLDDNIVETGDPVTFSDLDILETKTDSISYLLDADIEEGTVFQYLLSVNNGDLVFSDTVTRVYGTEVVIFYDSCENMKYWSSSKWDITTEEYYSPEHSITDSPYGKYEAGVTNIITLDTVIDLSNVSMAFLHYQAKWDIEEGFDYVQVQVKNVDGGTWIPMSGQYSSYGNYYLDPGDPVYDGVQDDWVYETINLMDFAGSHISVRFVLKTDYYVQADGFYFDDFSISVISSLTGINPGKQADAGLFVSEAYPNPAFDAFEVQYKIKINSGVEFELYDVSGHRLKRIPLNDSQGVLKINVAGLQKGIYYFRLTNGNRASGTMKFVKL
ncbi:MAG: T9SS type A sorting domain-containing protein [Chlorobi bacterium]|nr:T9SS type A sorting domain-containing protein [Chlorobiota bacterium]